MFDQMVSNIPITSEGAVISARCPSLEHLFSNDILIWDIRVQHPQNLKEEEGAAQKGPHVLRLRPP